MRIWTCQQGSSFSKQITVRVKFFPRFWRNHLKCREKLYLIWTGCLFSLRWSKKNIFLEKKIKMANSFSSSSNFQYFLWDFYDLGFKKNRTMFQIRLLKNALNWVIALDRAEVASCIRIDTWECFNLVGILSKDF